MKRVIFASGILFLFACTKTKSALTNTPTTPAACAVVSISDINKKTSHYNPYFIPFTNYRGLVNAPASISSCVSTPGRIFLNLNKNSIPDLVITLTDGCGLAKGKVFVFIDNVLKWTFEDPQVLTRKVATGDFNEDGIDDLVLFGSGHDGPPFPGDKNYIIYFYASSYEIKELDTLSLFFHNGTVGDINNDGHLDIIPIPNQNWDCIAFLNDGKGNFIKKKLFDGSYTDNAYQSELYDVNNDGKLDIILGVQEYSNQPWQNPNTRILLGDGNGNFDKNNPILIPTVPGWGVVTDLDFYDLDNDGIEELIITRTSGSLGSDVNGLKKNPGGWYDDFRIQILKKNLNNYNQIALLISPLGYENTYFEWIDWMCVKDVDGDCFLDIVPDSENLNDPTFADLKLYNKLFYKGDGKGGFTIAYKN